MTATNIDRTIEQIAAVLRTAVDAEVRRLIAERLNDAFGNVVDNAHAAAVDAAPKPKKRKRGYTYEFAAKPCPITAKLNRNRRASYLAPEVNTPENAAKFAGWMNLSADQQLALGVNPVSVQTLKLHAAQ